MKLIINNDKLEIELSKAINSGSINYYDVECEFNEAWDNLIKEIIIKKQDEEEGIKRTVVNGIALIDCKVNGLYQIGAKGYSIQYNLTSDTEINPNKIYYVNDGVAFIKVKNPVVESISTYYEAQKTLQISTGMKKIPVNLGAGEVEISDEEIPSPTEFEIYIHQIQEIISGTENLNIEQQRVDDGVEITITKKDGTTQTEKVNDGREIERPYTSLERLGAYLYKISFDIIPEEADADTLIGGCTSFVQNGKLYRNLDWNYNQDNSFLIQCKGFKGMAFINGLDDENMDSELVGQLPYHLVDGVNENGIMVSTHILYNDWDWHGVGEKNIPLHKLPYIILNEVKSIEELSSKLANVLNNIGVSEALEEAEYLAQYIVTDGTITYAILPPTSNTGSYVIEDITSNPKLTNFRWVNDSTVVRTDLQERPTGVERWNLIPTSLEDLRFTKAYEEPMRLSEFIGINHTTKDSTDEQLLSIYNQAHSIYEERQRDGQLWQTTHSIVYSSKGIEELYVQENYNINYAIKIPIKTSELINDSNFVADSNYVHTDNNFSDVEKDKLAELENYDDTEIRQELENKADVDDIPTKLENLEEDTTHRTVTDEEKQTWNNKAETSDIPTELSQLSDDSTHRLVSDTEKAGWNGKAEISDIPTNVSELNNDSNYQNNTEVASAINTHNQDITAHPYIQDRITGIEGKIPNQASSENQLADKSFVNSSISTATATFNGTWDSIEDFPTTGVDENDYVFYRHIDSAGNTVFDRYKYTENEWGYEYTLNNSSFTAAQWAAINSQITSALVGQIGTNQSNISTILADYIKSTDYATDIKGGTLKTGNYLGKNSGGNAMAISATRNEYTNMGINSFIAKGTLDNLKSTTIDSNSTDIGYATPKAVYDYIQSLDAREVTY